MDNSIRVIALDPGLSIASWTVLDLKTDTQKITVNRFGSISPNREASLVAVKDQVEFYGKRLISLRFLQDSIRELMGEFNPMYIASEDAFYNPKFPSAYVALVEWITTVRMLLFNEYKKPLYMVQTRVAKQCIFGNGAGTKANIQEAIFNKEDLVFKQKKQAYSLNEHEADAIAVGYAFLRLKLPTLDLVKSQ